jgi:hypothetical protein
MQNKIAFGKIPSTLTAPKSQSFAAKVWNTQQKFAEGATKRTNRNEPNSSVSYLPYFSPDLKPITQAMHSHDGQTRIGDHFLAEARYKHI